MEVHTTLGEARKTEPRERRSWTVSEIELLHKMKAARYSTAVICSRLGRTANSVAEQWRWQNLDEDARKRRRDALRVRERKKRSYVAGPHKNLGYSTTAGRPSEELIADALKRAMTPRTITAAFFGDPPPGYSALDRRP